MIWLYCVLGAHLALGLVLDLVLGLVLAEC